MTARNGGTGRCYLSTSGEWLTVRTTGTTDDTPEQMTSHLRCDLCCLHISHTVARCEQERGQA